MINIELTQTEAENVISFLKSMSDRLTTLHKEAHSGVAQLVYLSGIQEVDRLVVNIAEQVEAQTEVEAEPQYQILTEA
jgi:hypothetical protein